MPSFSGEVLDMGRVRFLFKNTSKNYIKYVNFFNYPLGNKQVRSIVDFKNL